MTRTMDKTTNKIIHLLPFLDFSQSPLMNTWFCWALKLQFESLLMVEHNQHAARNNNPVLTAGPDQE